MMMKQHSTVFFHVSLLCVKQTMQISISSPPEPKRTPLFSPGTPRCRLYSERNRITYKRDCQARRWARRVRTGRVPPPVVGGRLLGHTALNHSRGGLHSSQTTFHPSSTHGVLFRSLRFLLTAHNIQIGLSAETVSYSLHLVSIDTQSLQHP